MNILYSVDEKTLYYYKQDNEHVVNTFYDIIYILPKDICKIISEYYNCIIVDLVFTHEMIIINIDNEYIDFKKIIHDGSLKEYSYANNWFFSINNESTIYKCLEYDDYRSVYTLDEYMNCIYKIKYYFLGKYNRVYENCPIKITDSLILIGKFGKKNTFEILDIMLFKYLIEIYKSIINMHNKKYSSVL